MATPAAPPCLPAIPAQRRLAIETDSPAGRRDVVKNSEPALRGMPPRNVGYRSAQLAELPERAISPVRCASRTGAKTPRRLRQARSQQTKKRLTGSRRDMAFEQLLRPRIRPAGIFPVHRPCGQWTGDELVGLIGIDRLITRRAIGHQLIRLIAQPRRSENSVRRESRRFPAGANPARPIGRSAGSNQSGARR